MLPCRCACGLASWFAILAVICKICTNRANCNFLHLAHTSRCTGLQLPWVRAMHHPCRCWRLHAPFYPFRPFSAPAAESSAVHLQLRRTCTAMCHGALPVTISTGRLAYCVVNPS